MRAHRGLRAVCQSGLDDHAATPQQATCFFVEGLCYTRRRLLLALWDAGAAVGKSFAPRGYWGMGLALLVLIWLITLISTYFFVAKTWWLPVGASAAAHWIDGQFALTFVIMGIVF